MADTKQAPNSAGSVLLGFAIIATLCYGAYKAVGYVAGAINSSALASPKSQPADFEVGQCYFAPGKTKDVTYRVLSAERENGDVLVFQRLDETGWTTPIVFSRAMAGSVEHIKIACPIR